MGWSYGFKFPIITNDTGGIVDLMVTKGNIHGGKPLRPERFIAKLYGKPFGDKGYIYKELFIVFFSNGIHIITKLGKKMRTKPVTPVTRFISLGEKIHYTDNT